MKRRHEIKLNLFNKKKNNFLFLVSIIVFPFLHELIAYGCYFTKKFTIARKIETFSLNLILHLNKIKENFIK